MALWQRHRGLRAQGDYRFQGQTFDAGSYVVFMNAGAARPADTALSIGVDVSNSSPPLRASGAWATATCGARTSATIPTARRSARRDQVLKKPAGVNGGLERGRPTASRSTRATAVRTLNGLLGRPTRSSRSHPSTARAAPRAPRSSRRTQPRLDAAGRRRAADLPRVGELPSLSPIDRVPRIAVLTELEPRSTRTSGRFGTSASRRTASRPR